jgi:hypothetical protein
VLAYIPADLLSGGVGTFVNLTMSPMLYRSFVTNLIWFAASLLVIFQFLCLISRRFDFRSAVATVLLLGTIIMVSSLRFGLRYTFYVYVFYVLAWGSVVFLWLRLALSQFIADPKAAPSGGHLAPPKMVAGLLLTVGAAGFVALTLARAHQSNMLLPLIADWTNRSKIAANFQISDIGAGKSLIRILSPMPLSTGGVRLSDAPVTNKVEMSVVALEFDGKSCADRLITVTSISEPDFSNPSSDTASFRSSFSISETFSVTLRDGKDYIAFLPAFNYRHADGLGNSIPITYSGIRMDSSNLPCLRAVRLVTDFKKEDVLFDFFVPKSANDLKKDDLFNRFYLPGLRFI